MNQPIVIKFESPKSIGEIYEIFVHDKQEAIRLAAGNIDALTLMKRQAQNELAEIENLLSKAKGYGLCHIETGD